MEATQNSLPEIAIREYRLDDSLQIKECLLVLQDFVHLLEPKIVATGSKVFDSYFEYLINEINKKDGKIFVVESRNAIVGFVGLFVTQEEWESEKSLYISDLVVLEKYRGLGLGTKLLEYVEDYAKQQGAKFIKIGALEKNHGALDLYRKMGFADYLVVLLKTL